MLVPNLHFAQLETDPAVVEVMNIVCVDDLSDSSDNEPGTNF